MNKISSKAVRFFQKSLLYWFSANRRDLPWRRTYDPYQVWISEIMLQQTQVKTVLPYFDRWMKALPNIESVARADEDKILKLWEGLGYYTRARNLHKAAKVIVEKHNGKFPQHLTDIRALPGIGRYTAGAIASIAFNQPEPIVDGNVIRVLARWTNFRKNTRDKENLEFIWCLAKSLIPKKSTRTINARNFNQALMEFGALVCTPKSPACSSCPVKAECQAFAKGTQEKIPNLGPKSKKIAIQVALAVIRHPETNPSKSNKFFIQQRQHKGLMGGLWEFPGGKLEPSETPEKALRREIKEELGITLKSPRPILRIKHAYTKYTVDLHCFLADYADGKIQPATAQNYRWATLREMKKLAFPAANAKIIDHLRKKTFDSE